MSDFLMTWTKEYLPSKPEVIFDIGSFDGTDSIHFRKKFPNARIIAFEASKKNFQNLLENAKNKNIEAHHLALSDKEGEILFHDSTGKSNCSGSILNPLKKDNEIIFHEPYKVPTQSLDDFCLSNNISEIDIIHMDVQGAEWIVMDGLKKVSCKMIFAEVSEENNYSQTKSRAEFDQLMKLKGFIKVRELKFDNLYLHKSILTNKNINILHRILEQYEKFCKKMKIRYLKFKGFIYRSVYRKFR